MSKKYHIDGIKEVMDALDDLKPKLKDQVLRSFLRKTASKEVVKPLRSHLPYSKKTTKHIRVGISRRDRNKTSVYAGPTSDRFWIRFTEKGTKQRYTKKGAYKGQLKAKNRIEPFVNSRIDGVVKYFNKEMGNEVERILAKKIKRLRKK